MGESDWRARHMYLNARPTQVQKAAGKSLTCEKCGAPRRRNKCDYCGTLYGGGGDEYMMNGWSYCCSGRNDKE